MNTRIVIAGGGFAGLYAAMHLGKTLARDTEVESQERLSRCSRYATLRCSLIRKCGFAA
jgi:NADH dehydrogenase FAD-containing subunit